MRSIVHTSACILAIVCGLPAPATAVPVLRIGVAYAPKTLNPALAADAASARLLQLTHPALLRYNAAYQPVPLIAQSCTQPTPMQATCTLPKATRFDDGSPLTGHSVAAWFGQLQNNPRSPFAATLKDIFITTPTPETITFTLPQPTPLFLTKLTEIPLANPASPTMGLGAYQVTAQDVLGTTTLSPKSSPSPTLVFQVVPDATTRLLKLKNHELDTVLQDIPPDMFTWATQRGFHGLTAPSSSHTYIGFNLSQPLLAHADVRRALTLATPRQAIRAHLLPGQASPATTLLPPTHPLAWHAPQEPYNPAAAKALLKPYCTLTCTLTLTTSTDPFVQRVAQVIQQAWARAGVTLKVQPMEWGSFFGAVQKGRFDMVLLTWTGDQSPAFYYQAFHGSQTPPNGLNRGRLNDPALNTLLENLPTTVIDVQKALATLRPTIPLYRRAHTALVAPGVTGCTLSPSGDYQGLTTCQKTAP